MAQINTYYRAFIDYRKQTEIDKLCKRDRKLLSKIENSFEKFEVTKFQIEIDESWVVEIEKGLEFIEKAIKEERQFIRTNGEIVPIEKVKKVSRDSVSHLAKHSEMITHLPDDPTDTIVPDKIFMVEKLNDYAVYENRFIYMLLCYLRDFIELRIKKIMDIRMTYICDFIIKRNQVTKNKVMNFETHYYENRKDNPYPIDNEISNGIIQRINDCAEIVNMLLNTPLMTEVSKAPMIKPPIVKTNVLKMNNNFKNALVLYDYIVNYKGDGYSSEEVVKNFIPLEDSQLDEFMELPCITSFITYKFGNEITENLHKEYLDEEELRRQKEEKELQEQIKRMRKKVLESGKGYEEYMLLLEKEIRNLEEDRQNLIKAKLEIIELNKRIDLLNDTVERLNQEILELKAEIERKIQEIADLHVYYKGEIARIINEYEEKIVELKRVHAEEIAELKRVHAEEIAKLKRVHEEAIAELKRVHEEEIAELKRIHQEAIDTLIQKYENQIDEINQAHLTEKESIISEYEDKLERITLESKEKIDLLSNELDELERKHQQLVQTSADEITSLSNKVSELESEKSNLVSNYENKVKSLENSCEQQLKDSKELYEKIISDNKNAYDTEIINIQKNCNTEINNTKKECKDKIDDMSLEVKQAIYDRNLMAAELKAIRIQNGLVVVSEEYANKDRFEELEREFMAFNNFFKAQWNLTKKLIRKELFGVKPQKEKNKKINKKLADNASSAIKDSEPKE